MDRFYHNYSPQAISGTKAANSGSSRNRRSRPIANIRLEFEAIRQHLANILSKLEPSPCLLLVCKLWRLDLPFGIQWKMRSRWKLAVGWQGLSKAMISEWAFISHNFVSEGMPCAAWGGNIAQKASRTLQGEKQLAIWNARERPQLQFQYHWTENYYIVISETIFDVNYYMAFS